jgi:hypothetical protein
MMRARWLLVGGASFATLAAFTIGASAIAGTPEAHSTGVVHRATATSSRARSPLVATAEVDASRRAEAFMTGGVRSWSQGSATPMTHTTASAPQIPAQTVSSVFPNAGASGPGGEQKVVITGSGFTGATDVFFGGTDVSSQAYPCLTSAAGCFTFVSDTEIDADTPVESAGTFDVVINGSTTGPQDQYSYFDPPTVSTVASPQPQGATGIAVTGTNFSYPGVTPFASGVSEVDLVPTGAGSTVKITNVCGGGSPPNCFLATDDTHLSIDLPNSMPSGQYDTEVITPGGTSATSTNDLLTVQPPAPTLTNLNPSSGSTVGGINVTLTGTNFTGATAVNWGGGVIPLCGTGTCFTVDTDTQITVDNIPSDAAGGVTVNVVTPSGPSNNKTYTYVTPTPTLTNLNPSSGSTVGGINVTLTGTNFTGATAVNWGGGVIPLCGTGTCFTVDTDTQITVDNIPSGAAGGVTVNVVTPSGPSNNKTYTYVTPTPTLTNLNPSSGSTVGGINVTLTGTNFTGATAVNWGGGVIPLCGTGTCYKIDSDTQITVDNVPSGAAGGVTVNVVTPSGPSNNKIYTYVTPAPTLTLLNPSSGSTVGGINGTLTGTSFTGATAVNWGGGVIPLCGTGTCFTIDSDTQITVDNIPNGAAGGVTVNVVTPSGPSNNKTYTYVTPTPTLTNLNPSSGSTAGGNNVTLTGTNFTGATDVQVGSFDLKPCPSAPCFMVNNSNQITVTMPANVPGNVSINVTTPGGTTGSLQYAYVAPTPSVTKVSPNDGTPNGANIVALTGTDFEAAGTPITTHVTVGTFDFTLTPCGTTPTSPCFTVNSATSITIGFMPPGTGQVNITVTTPGGISPATSSNLYTYNPLVPTVTEVLPKYGAAAGGEAVSLFGSGFGQAGQDFVTDVSFGSSDIPSSNSYPCPNAVAAGCFIVVGPTQLAIYTPAHAVGTVDVQVTTPRGPSGITAADRYTFVPPGAYTAVPPYRACDTRPPVGGIVQNQCDTAPNHTLGVNGVVTAQITRTGGEVPPGAQAVVVNVTAIDHSSGITLVKVYPAGTTRPDASNINLAGNTVESNLVIVQLSQAGGTVPAGAITLYNALGTADVIVDVEGYFSSPTGGGHAGEFHSIPPLRICDSRANMRTICAGATSTPLVPRKWRDVVLSGLPPGAPVGTPSIPATPGTAAAAVFNLTGTNGTLPTLIAVAPALANHLCPSTPPAFSNLNPSAGSALAIRVISKLGPNQDVCLFSPVGSINFITDVNGWFGSSTALAGVLFYSIPPTRVCDTRLTYGSTCPPVLTPGLTPNITRLIGIASAGAIAVPADDQHSVEPAAIVANLTGISGTANTVFILYPSDKARSGTSDLNPSAHQVIANLAIVGLSTTPSTNNGDVSLYNAVGDINAVLDVAGWFQ